MNLVLTPIERAELIRCIEAGAAAFSRGTAHSDNPYLASDEFNYPGRARAKLLALEKIEAWWDGWEECDLGSKQSACKARETIPF